MIEMGGSDRERRGTVREGMESGEEWLKRGVF